MKFGFKKNLPSRDALRSAKSLLSDSSYFSVKEAYKTARTNLMFATTATQGCKTIVVSSPLPREGKTTTVINLAIAFAQAGIKTLLIDSDLRKPRIHKYIGVDSTEVVGFSNLAGGFAELDEAIIHTEYGFDCITAGAVPPNPSELLSSSVTDDILSKLSEMYEYILIDSPPLNLVTDAAILSTHATGALLITRFNTTRYDYLDKAISALKFADANLLGFILNDVPINSGKYYRYKYNYKYRYKYKQYS